MWTCSNCGSRCDADFCATCGTPRGSGTSGVRSALGSTIAKSTGNTNRVLEIAVAVLLLIGIILLLFTPLVSGSEYGTSYSYNIQKLHQAVIIIKEQAQSYVDMLGSDNSDVQQAMSTVNSIIFVLVTLILFLYATALITVINLFKKMPRLYTAARWISLTIGAILLFLLIYAKSQMEEVSSGLMGSFISSYVKLGFFGIILGLLFIGAAILLHAKPELFSSVPFGWFEEKIGFQWRCNSDLCGHINSSGSKFCSACGTRKGTGHVTPPPATWRCSNPSCGHTNADSSLFCAKCGTRKGRGTVAPPPPNYWTCANGHTNNSDSEFCSVCDIAKNAVVAPPKPQWRCTCGRDNDAGRTVCGYCGKSKNGGDSGLFEKNPEF